MGTSAVNNGGPHLGRDVPRFRTRCGPSTGCPSIDPRLPACVPAPAVQPPNQAADYVVGVMSNLTAAMMCVAGSLRHLTFETQGCLVVSQWAAALTKLESACFIGGDVHLKQASLVLHAAAACGGGQPALT